jgi:hypothetical protein
LAIYEHLYHEGEEKYEEVAILMNVWQKRADGIIGYFPSDDSQTPKGPVPGFPGRAAVELRENNSE